MNLDKLGLNTGTDKSSANHNYLHAYQGLFAPIVPRVRDVLEIGVWKGESIRMWEHFFVGGTKITGYDIKLMDEALKDTGLHTVLRELDAYDYGAVRRTGAQDVIIDDGPHTLNSMRFSASNYAPLVKPGGVFVIEDVPDIGWCEVLTQDLPEHLRPISYTIDCRNTSVSETKDDILFVVDRRNA